MKYIPLVIFSLLLGAGCVADTPAPESVPAWQTSVFTVKVDDRTIEAHVFSPPPGKLAKDPLLLMTFAMDWKTSLTVEPYDITAQEFLKQGHRVLSFDIPNHGARVNEYGQAITGLRNAFVAGHDPFAMFTRDAVAVLDRCIEDGLTTPGKVVACGTSRAGYLALRFMAAEPRLSGVAVYAPVTDWRDLTEFAADKTNPGVAELNIANYADKLAGRPLSVVIGNHDTRVNTASCCRFYIALQDASARKKVDDTGLNFRVLDTPGHSSQPAWYAESAAFLIKAASTR